MLTRSEIAGDAICDHSKSWPVSISTDDHWGFLPMRNLRISTDDHWWFLLMRNMRISTHEKSKSWSLRNFNDDHWGFLLMRNRRISTDEKSTRCFLKADHWAFLPMITEDFYWWEIWGFLLMRNLRISTDEKINPIFSAHFPSYPSVQMHGVVSNNSA